AVKCSPGGPNDYIYVIVQPPGWAKIAELIGRPELADDPEWATPEARLNKLDKMFQMIEEWTTQHDKWAIMDILNAVNVPCGPILSTKELLEDESLAKTGAVVEVEHPQRGAFKTVGCPIRLSDSPVEVYTSPALGEHNAEILQDIGIDPSELDALKEAGVI
ncbi:MAG: CoA transferase, partial [Actinobacteria bacterium]|nr:CoA transferase [Actinomycetota bacterium]